MKRIKNYIFRHFYYFCNRKKFGFLARNAVVQSLLRLDGRENIYIGNKVIIQKFTWLAALPLTNHEDCRLEIGNGCQIGHFNHIYATYRIVFGENVLTADKVYIADNRHIYENIDEAILDQPVKQLNEVYIGEGSWIGENVCIIGASIGKHCVIGANSVVNESIPDYCIAVGAPAKVIKKFNFINNRWEKI
ncbi:MAG: acyltransferase [Bacteroidota bacterium]